MVQKNDTYTFLHGHGRGNPEIIMANNLIGGLI
jgi:hypothetical protein